MTAVDTEMTFDEKWSEAIDYLNSKYVFFVTDVLNMGRPKVTTATPTADVSISKDGQFAFRFNPEFAKQLSVETFAFILAHECMHLILRHLDLMKKYLAPFAKEKHKEEFQVQMMKANIAMDCVINDLLDLNGFTIPEGFMRGMNIIKEDCSFLSFSDVFKKIPENTANQTLIMMGGKATAGAGGDDHGWIFDPQTDDDDSDDDSDGDSDAPDGLTAEDIQKMFEEAINEAMSSSVNQFLSQNGLDTSNVNAGRAPGKGTGSAHSFAEVNGISMRWVELLRKVNPDMFKGVGPKMMPTYRQQPRSLLSVYPDVILPRYEKNPMLLSRDSERPSIVLAIDTSGSITDAMRNTFLTLGRSIPENQVHVFPMGFNERPYEIDLKNPRTIGGGTDFNAIEDYIQKNVIPKNKGHYPKAIVVITDLYATFHRPPAANLRDNWTWLHTGETRHSYYNGLVNLGFKNFFHMKEFMK